MCCSRRAHAALWPLPSTADAADGAVWNTKPEASCVPKASAVNVNTYTFEHFCTQLRAGDFASTIRTHGSWVPSSVIISLLDHLSNLFHCNISTIPWSIYSSEYSAKQSEWLKQVKATTKKGDLEALVSSLREELGQLRVIKVYLFSFMIACAPPWNSTHFDCFSFWLYHRFSVLLLSWCCESRIHWCFFFCHMTLVIGY
jgi:hypothetical protein